MLKRQKLKRFIWYLVVSRILLVIVGRILWVMLVLQL